MRKLFAIAMTLLTVLSIDAAETLKENFNTITNGQSLLQAANCRNCSKK